MSVTAKRFYTSTLIKAVGCTAATLRAWRTRNGLFPETHDSGTWNKFSIIDMFVASIVKELTSRGMPAQLAVDVAVAAGPVLTKLCEDVPPLDDEDPDDMGEVFLQAAYPIAKSNSALGLKLREGHPPAVVLLKSDLAIRDALADSVSDLIDLRKLLLVAGSLLLHDVELENSHGKRDRKLSAWTEEARRLGLTMDAFVDSSNAARRKKS